MIGSNLLKLKGFYTETMLIRKLNHCEEFTAGDRTILRELLHPDKQAIELRYSLAHAILPAGATSLPHSLTTSEVYYILSGTGEMSIDNQVQSIEPGDAVYIPPNAVQFLRNTGTEAIVFICIVDPAWQKTDETIY
jgi:mannose-6-phosphate isomerase-like protein (cupin superfamily)